MGQKLKRHLTTAVACPTCGAKRGKPCVAPAPRRSRQAVVVNGVIRVRMRIDAVRWLHRARRVS